MRSHAEDLSPLAVRLRKTKMLPLCEAGTDALIEWSQQELNPAVTPALISRYPKRHRRPFNQQNHSRISIPFSPHIPADAY